MADDDDFDSIADDLAKQRALSPPSATVIPFPQAPQDKTDPQFDDVADSLFTARQQRVSQTLATANRMGPDQIAKARSLSEQTGIPQPAVQQNLQQIERGAQLKQATDAVTADPKMQQWAEHEPTDLMQASDDFEKLPVLAKITQALAWGVQQGHLENQIGRAGSLIQMAHAPAALGLDAVATPEQDKQVQAAQLKLNAIPQLHGGYWLAQWVGQAAGSIGEHMAVARYYGMAGAAGGAALAAATGPVAPADVGPLMLGGYTAGTLYGTALDWGRTFTGNAYLASQNIRGVDGQPLTETGRQLVGLTAGIAGGFLSAWHIPGTEKLLDAGFQKILGEALARQAVKPTVAQALKTWAGATAKQAVGGGLMFGGQEAAQILAEEMAKQISPGQFFSDPAEMAERIATAFGQGALQMGALGGAAASMGMYGDFLQARRADEHAQMLKSLMDGSADSKLRQRDLAAFQRFMQYQLQGQPAEHVYVPASKVLELYQSAKLDPNGPRQADTLFGFVPDMPQQLKEAMTTNGDVVIPTADYVAHLAGTPAAERLLPDIRVGAASMSVNEAKEYTAKHQEAAKTALEQASKAEPQPADLIAQDIQRQAEAAGRPKAEASKYAQIAAARVTTRAERLGVDPMELYKQEPLQIQRQGAAATRPTLVATEVKQEPIAQEQKGATAPDLTAPPAEPDEAASSEADRPLAFDTFDRPKLEQMVKSVQKRVDVAKAKFEEAKRIDRRGMQSGNEPKQKAEGVKRAEDDLKQIKDELDRRSKPYYQGQERGSIRFESGARIISLFANADHSTLIHESGHAWLEEMMAAAKRPYAPQAVKDDAAATLKWLGVDNVGQIDVQHHEQFARGVEAYLMEEGAYTRAGQRLCPLQAVAHEDLPDGLDAEHADQSGHPGRVRPTAGHR